MFCRHSATSAGCSRPACARRASVIASEVVGDRPTERQVQFAVALCRQQPGVFGTVTPESVAAFERTLRNDSSRSQVSEMISRLTEEN